MPTRSGAAGGLAEAGGDGGGAAVVVVVVTVVVGFVVVGLDDVESVTLTVTGIVDVLGVVADDVLGAVARGRA